MPLSIALVGARGRMGQTISSLAAAADATIATGLDVGDDLAVGLAQGDVIIDFSSHQITETIVQHAIALKKPLVIGTTGHRAEHKAALKKALAAAIPCVWAGNYSVGVNVLNALTQQAARVLTDGYDIEVIEMHHRFKKDAPSGTAARLLEIILEARKLGADALRHGREGITGERTRQEIGVHALRGGDVVGDHTVMFAAPGERIELTHKASDRAIFARGALRAAHWVMAQSAPGVYDMQAVLGL